jgi:hypothetical protein
MWHAIEWLGATVAICVTWLLSLNLIMMRLFDSATPAERCRVIEALEPWSPSSLLPHRPPGRASLRSNALIEPFNRLSQLPPGPSHGDPRPARDRGSRRLSDDGAKVVMSSPRPRGKSRAQL